MSIVVELNEVRTAWQDSDFITECLCWHNVYRQRHGAPTLSMSPEVIQHIKLIHSSNKRIYLSYNIISECFLTCLTYFFSYVDWLKHGQTT